MDNTNTPETKKKMTAKDFFLYLGILITLYLSSIALITFLFSAINIGFPKPHDFSDNTESIAWSLSVFIVFYPILIILLGSALKNIRKFPEKASLGVRHWFIYLTLFVTALTIAVDLIVLINYFLSGEEITIGFILKIVSIVLVAGLVFWFTLKDLKGKFIEDNKLFNIFRAGTSAVIIALIVSGLFLIGSPSELRNKKDDRTRVDDLSRLQSEIIYFWQSKERLPSSLDELDDDLRGFQVPTDPETEERYGYEVNGQMSFSLCATFETDNTDEESPRSAFSKDDSFDHKSGYTCFDRTIDPEKFPQIKDPIPVI